MGNERKTPNRLPEGTASPRYDTSPIPRPAMVLRKRKDLVDPSVALGASGGGQLAAESSSALQPEALSIHHNITGGEGALRREINIDLTEEELAILQRAASSLTNRQIALDLGISVNIVKTRLTNIGRRLGTRTREGSASRAIILRSLDPLLLPHDYDVSTIHTLSPAERLASDVLVNHPDESYAEAFARSRVVVRGGTAKNYARVIFRKLGVEDRMGLIRFYLARQRFEADPERGRDIVLTDTQMLQLEKMAEGLDDKEISESLGIDQITVGRNRGRIYDRLQAETRIEAVLAAIRDKLIDTSKIAGVLVYARLTRLSEWEIDMIASTFNTPDGDMNHVLAQKLHTEKSISIDIFT